MVEKVKVIIDSSSDLTFDEIEKIQCGCNSSDN